MENRFKMFSEKSSKHFEKYLLSHIEEHSGTNLEASMNYSLDAKGKRLRPLLLLAVIQSFNGDLTDGYPAATALEMIHTYSLIHDDLPAMDDDMLRRGNPTNHIQFDEATAILAGDALLTLAFKVIVQGDLDAQVKVELVELLADTSGYEGMVGGQKSDIDGENSSLNLEEIERIHFRKTGALIKMATVSGGKITGQSNTVIEHLIRFSEEIGIAYQIRDDILDVVGTEEELGKGVATDAELGKSTYPSLLGLDGAFEALNIRLENAKESLDSIKMLTSDFDSTLLNDFTDLLALEEYKS